MAQRKGQPALSAGAGRPGPEVPGPPGRRRW